GEEAERATGPARCREAEIEGADGLKQHPSPVPMRVVQKNPSATGGKALKPAPGRKNARRSLRPFRTTAMATGDGSRGAAADLPQPTPSTSRGKIAEGGHHVAETGGTAFARSRFSWRVEIISCREEEPPCSQLISNSTPRPGRNFSSCCARV